MRSSYRYVAFGLRVESAWPISSLAAAEQRFDGVPDVEISNGPVTLPEGLHDVEGMQAGIHGDRYFVGIEECGSFEIVAGRTIVVQPLPNVTLEQVNLFLLGSVFGALLHQRGKVPFHCNGVEVDGSAFLFCGDSGTGKSTLAAHFVKRGFSLLSDDVCALGYAANGEIMAFAGVPRLKLWQDALDHFGQPSDSLRLVPWYTDKFELPLGGRDMPESIPVAGIYHLRAATDGRDPGIYPLRGLEAANSVTANIYRRRLADLAGATSQYLDLTARIIGHVPVFTVNRRWGLAHFENEALQIERHIHQAAENWGKSTQRHDGSS